MSIGLVRVEVIPPASKYSPFYTGHLRFWEMINVSMQQSKTREYYITSMKNKHTQNNTHTQHIGLDNDVPQPPLTLQQSSGLYAVRLQIGTGAIPYLLALDTASNIIWLQCSECSANNACFPQMQPPPYNCLINPRSCQPFICTNNNECKKGECIGNHCTYNQKFYDNSVTYGYFALETFTFNANHRENLVERHLEFGCGINQFGFSYFRNPNYIAGVMGMSRASTSLPRQLGKGIFSHCLPSGVGLSRPSFLSFGSEILTHAGFSRVEMPVDPRPEHKRIYSVKLTRISISDEEKVDIYNTLAIIDTGTRLTILSYGVYDQLIQILEDHFSKNQMIVSRIAYRDLACYKWVRQPRNPYDNLPHFKFTLGTADFRIKPEAAFLVNENNFRQFCLGMKRGRADTTLIGARALTNHRVVYDSRRNQNLFHFKEETC